MWVTGVQTCALPIFWGWQGEAASEEDGMIGRCRVVGVIKRAEAWTRGKKDGGSDLGAPPSVGTHGLSPPTAPGFLGNLTKALGGGFIWEVRFSFKNEAKT